MDETTVESKPIASKAGGSRLFGIKIIKTRFQFKFSLIIFTFLAISAGSVWFWGNATVNKMIDSGMVRGDDAIESMRVLRDNIAYISFLSLAITFGLSLFFSHYIAGPIYRFEKTLESIRDAGDLTVFVRLRKHDEFKEVADLFNQALVSLRNKIKKERAATEPQLEKLKEMATSLQKAGMANESAAIGKIISEMKNVPPQLKI